MKRWLRALAVLCLAAAVGLAARQWLVGTVRIAGNSMGTRCAPATSCW